MPVAPDRPTDEPLPVYVLVGGGSQRFGSAKATHPVDGQPWALHVATRLSSDTPRVAMVGNAALPELCDVRFVPDHPRYQGPLTGALAAIEDRLEQYGPGRLVLASCDLVRPEPRWLTPLCVAHDEQLLDVAAYRIDGLWQPFPSVVHTRWRAQLSQLLAGGRRSFQAVLDESETQSVSWESAPASGPPQANTPEALRALFSENDRGD
ncbi:MAG: NTP transferase domain-containing protein [Planctomycetota bacterium]